MKTVIENGVNTKSLNDEECKDLMREFNIIIMTLNMSWTETHLRKFMKSNGKLKYFDYGFGSSHIWVKQSKTENRILFCEF